MAETEILKKKKKKTYLLLAKEFENAEIGETLASEDSLVMNRTIEISLSQITNDPKSQNVKVKFKVKEVKDNKGYADLAKYFMIPTYIRRVVKPGREKMEDSFKIVTKDNVRVMIKTLLLTKAKTQNSVLSMLRLRTREYFGDYGKKNDYRKLLNDVIMHTIQRDLKQFLNKVYPLNVCEIRHMEKVI